MFVDITGAPKLLWKYAETWVFIAVSEQWLLGENIRGSSYCFEVSHIDTAVLCATCQRLSHWAICTNALMSKFKSVRYILWWYQCHSNLTFPQNDAIWLVMFCYDLEPTNFIFPMTVSYFIGMGFFIIFWIILCLWINLRYITKTVISQKQNKAHNLWLRVNYITNSSRLTRSIPNVVKDNKVLFPLPALFHRSLLGRCLP